MKYRVRLDLSFDAKEDADTLVEAVKKLQSRATNINEGATNEEMSYLVYHLCGHDEGKPCQIIESIELRSQ